MYLTPQKNAEQTPAPPRVSLVVVSHNRVERLRRCLESIGKLEDRATIQVIVIDNGSRDGSAQLDAEFSNLQWVRLPKNFGLTKAWNLGWRAADAPYVFFLHDDTELEPQTVNRLAEVLDQNFEAAAVCPLLVDGEGRPMPQLGNLPPSMEWRAAHPAGEEPFAVQYTSGAALMVRVFNIKAIRQIDERYGQFGADADLCTQIVRAGRKILLVPAAHVRHTGGDTRSSLERADMIQSRSVYIGKYEGFAAGLRAKIGSALGSFAGFRLGELKHLLAGQKIDGTQG